MKICFIAGFNGGGTERAAFLLANELQKHHEVYILNKSPDRPTFPLKAAHLDYLPRKGVIPTIFAIRKYIRANRIDLMIILEALGGICALPAACFCKCRTIVWEHANYYQTQGCSYNRFVRQMELLFADAYVVLTRRDLNTFRERYPHIRTELVQIYNIAELGQEEKYDPDSKTIVSAGHISKIKNFSVIPRIAAQVFENHSDWKWKIYGERADDEYERLEENINRYRMTEKVLLCGRCSDMDTVYREASVYVMTSLQEGFPMVLLEAKSHHLPIVSFDIETGPDELIRDGENGFLVPPYETEKMAEKIERLLNEKDLRMRFSGKAADGLENITKEKIAAQWLALFEKIRRKKENA